MFRIGLNCHDKQNCGQIFILCPSYENSKGEKLKKVHKDCLSFFKAGLFLWRSGFLDAAKNVTIFWQELMVSKMVILVFR